MRGHVGIGKRKTPRKKELLEGPQRSRSLPWAPSIVLSQLELPLSPLRAGRSLHIIGGRSGLGLARSQPNTKLPCFVDVSIGTADALSSSLRSPSLSPAKTSTSLANYHESLLVFLFLLLLFSGALPLYHTQPKRLHSRATIPSYDPPPKHPDCSLLLSIS